jgi:hypothetical protein
MGILVLQFCFKSLKKRAGFSPLVLLWFLAGGYAIRRAFRNYIYNILHDVTSSAK